MPAARNPWIATGVVITGSVLVVLDTTIVNVALHQIAVDLGAGSGVEWVATAYFLGVCAALPATGWLADTFGRKRVFLVSLSVFILASLGCALSPNLGVLIAFRVVQGLGGGALTPIATTMVLELFPRVRHGRAMAVSTMAVMMTPAIGPTVGGLIVTHATWHWLFLVNVPIGVAAVAAGIVLIPAFGHRERRQFDTPGLILGSGGLTLVVLGLSQGNGWGWSSAPTVSVLVVGLAALAAFVRHELRTEHPMIDVRIFTVRAYTLAMGAMFFITMAQFGRLVFIPLELESLRGFTALHVGLLLAPPAFFGMFFTWLGGRTTDRIGPRLPIMCGCVVAFVALVGMARLTLDTSTLWIQVLLIVQSSGIGLVLAPAMVAGLSELPPNLIAQGSAVRALTAQASGALAIGIFGAVVAAHMGADATPEHAQAAYNAAFVWAAGGAVIAFLLASRLSSRPIALPEGAALGAQFVE
jgi:DHA2 family multidrug resistance protein